MSFPGMDLPPEMRKAAWDHAVSQNTQDVVLRGMDPMTLYQVMCEYEKAIEAIRLTLGILPGSFN